jgi:hypothetical protein
MLEPVPSEGAQAWSGSYVSVHDLAASEERIAWVCVADKAQCKPFSNAKSREAI